jgi:ankyrin repeat protein
MMVYLIAVGLDIDTKDSLGRTPLMWTAYQGNSIQGMKELIKSDATIDLIDTTGFTALHWAVM